MSAYYSVIIVGCLVSDPSLCVNDEIAMAPSIKECQSIGIASVSAWTAKHREVAFERIDCIKHQR